MKPKGSFVVIYKKEQGYYTHSSHYTLKQAIKSAKKLAIKQRENKQ